MLIQLAAETCQTTASLLGQGDNQVVLLKIPSESLLASEGITESLYVDNFINFLVQYSDEAGIPIKPLETWQSHNLFAYSKRYHYKGAQVSTALKKISRLASEANQVVPTLNGDLSGLYSTGASGASEDVTPTAAYTCTMFEAAHILRRNMPWLREIEDSHTVTLVTTSRTLGGFPVTLYSNFCMRAVQDQLTSGLHLARSLLRHPTTRSGVSTYINMIPKTRLDLESLIKDPSSLPLATPLQSEHHLRDMIRQHLPTLIKNRSVKNLFDFNADTQKLNLIQDLTTMKPFNPRLANKLYSLSNFGLQEKYVSKFSGARSIQQATISQWSNEMDVIESIKTVEISNQNALKSKYASLTLTNILRPKESICITQLAQKLRDSMWKMNLEGITMAAQQEQTRLYRWEEVPTKWATRTILYIVDETVNNLGHMCRGKHTPYYGSATKMRTRRAPMQVLEVGNIISSIKQLMELRGWVKGDEHVTRLIDTLITEKTTVSLNTLLLYTRQVYSGAIAHILPCQALKRGGMANQNLNFSSHISIISALHYAKSGTNYTICFQSAFLYGLSALSHLQEQGFNIAGKWGLVFCNSCCVSEIPAEEFHFSTRHMTECICRTK